MGAAAALPRRAAHLRLVHRGRILLPGRMGRHHQLHAAQRLPEPAGRTAMV